MLRKVAMDMIRRGLRETPAAMLVPCRSERNNRLGRYSDIAVGKWIRMGSWRGCDGNPLGWREGCGTAAMTTSTYNGGNRPASSHGRNMVCSISKSYVEGFSSCVFRTKARLGMFEHARQMKWQHMVVQPYVTCRSTHIAHSGAFEEGIPEGYEEVEVELPEKCPGCGVKLQIDDPDAPGYCHVPKRLLDILQGNGTVKEEELEAVEDGEDIHYDPPINDEKDMDSFVKVSLDDDDSILSEFDRVIDVWDQEERGRKRSKRIEPQPEVFEEQSKEDDIFADLVCARCYSLKHYGQVKSQNAEAMLPGFDFGNTVGRSIARRQFRRSVVLAVVDLADFDGSLPRHAISSLIPEIGHAPGTERPQTFVLFIAANKSDLLPKEASNARLEQWVRKRVAEGGLPKPAAVHIISSHKGSGVKSLLVDIQKSVGNRGDVWVVGAQNAGKSSLINSMRKSAGLEPTMVTAAPLPGTTLGIVKVPGLIPTGCNMLDTPGVRHEYQMTSHLLPEEVKMVLPRKKLKPRTYRIASGNCISIGGLARVEVGTIPGGTVYLTLWASDDVRSHMGKSENAEELYKKHLGTRLTPPMGDKEGRMEQFPNLIATDVEIKGVSWKESSIDICIAGVGWLGVGVNGAATFKVWAPPGIAITTRVALIPDMAREFCRPGFDSLLPDSSTTKTKKRKSKKNS